MLGLVPCAFLRWLSTWLRDKGLKISGEKLNLSTIQCADHKLNRSRQFYVK